MAISCSYLETRMGAPPPLLEHIVSDLYESSMCLNRYASAWFNKFNVLAVLCVT